MSVGFMTFANVWLMLMGGYLMGWGLLASHNLSDRNSALVVIAGAIMAGIGVF